MKFKNQIIYIVDDEPEVCDALKWYFESLNFIVKTYNNAEDFLGNHKSHKLGCILLDVYLPGTSGLDLLVHLKSQKSVFPIIVMTGLGDIPMAVRAIKAGAVDFITKPLNKDSLLEIIKKCIFATEENSYDGIDKLTPREKQTLDLILDGKLNKEIAYLLTITISTVEAHRSHIMQKLKAKNIAQLINIYLQHRFHNESKLNTDENNLKERSE